MKNKTDLVSFDINKKTADNLLLAINSDIKELLYIQQKFINRIQFGDEILLTNEQAFLLSKLLEYRSDNALRCINVLIDDDYADKKTALDLIEHYQRLSNRFLFHSKRLKKVANNCINIMA